MGYVGASTSISAKKDPHRKISMYQFLWDHWAHSDYFETQILLKLLQERVQPHKLQSNLNSSNTDGSFTIDNSNSFFSPYKILPLAQEDKYLGRISYFIMELYDVCTH